MPARGELVPGGRGNPIGFALMPRRRTVPALADMEAREFAVVARDNLNELIRARLTPLEPALTHLAQSAYEDQRAEEVTALGPLPRVLPGRTYLREKQHDLTTGRGRKKSGEQSTSEREIAGEDGIVHPVVITHHLDKGGRVVLDSLTQKWPLKDGASADLKFTMNNGSLGMVEFYFGYDGNYAQYSTDRGNLYNQVFAPYWGPRTETHEDGNKDSREAVRAKAARVFPDSLYFDSREYSGGHIKIAVILDDQATNVSKSMKSYYSWMNSQAPHHVGPQVLIQNNRPHDYMTSVGHYGFDATKGKEGNFSVLSSKSGGQFYKQDDFGPNLSVAEFLNVFDHVLDLAGVIKTDPQAITA